MSDKASLLLPCACGTGKVRAFVDFADRRKSGVMEIDCPTCNGTARITVERAEWMRIGRVFRQRRLDRGEGMGECAARLGISRRHLGDAEQGRVDPRAVFGEP